MSKRQFLGALTFAIAALASSSVAASALQHPGWLPWHGCWRADGAPATELLCIVPDGAGVRMVTLEGGAVLAESRIITDGRARPIRQEGCSGTEQARWSVDGHRVFLGSDLSCDGGMTRKVSGIFAMTGLTDWVSAQAVTIDGKMATRSVRYTAVETSNLPSNLLLALNTSRTARVAAREAALAAIDERDVDDAMDNVDPAAVQEWLTATGQPFQLANDTQEQVVASASALDLAGGVAYSDSHVQREVVHVVERPTYVHHTTTYVHSGYRSCWDPFVSGWVSFGHGLGLGVTYSDCGRRYYSRYSPWGYDLYGWRFVHAPLLIVRGGPRIVRPIIVRGYRDRDYDRNYRDRNYRDRDYDRRSTPVGSRDRDYDDRGNNDRDNGSQGGRATRAGYSSGRPVAQSSSAPQRVSPTTRGVPTTRVEPATRTAPATRVAPTRRAEPATRYAPSPRPQSYGNDQSTRSAQSRYSPRASSESRGSTSTRAAPSVRSSGSSTTRATPSVRSSSSSNSGYGSRASAGSTSSRSSASPTRTARPRN